MDTKEKAYTLSNVTHLTDNGKTTLDKWINGSTYMSFTYCENTGSGSSSSSGSSTPSTPSTTPTTDISRDIVLVLDTSGSMSGTSLTYTKTAAKKFVDQILGTSNSTKIAIVTYSSSATTSVALTNDKATLTTAIDGLSAYGGTNIYNAMQTADTILQSSTANKKAIVLMSDGEANEGTTATSQTVTTEDGNVTFYSNDSALYNLANDYKDNKNYTIYSLGFGLSNNSDAYKLLKYMATYSNGARKFWSVTKDNLDDIVFTYEDIANTATAKILIVIDCPVTAAISRGSETLSKDNTSASFGNVSVTSVSDGYKYAFTLDDRSDYDIDIRGTSSGTMNFKITYVYGSTEQYHEFKGVPVTDSTKVTTSQTDRTTDHFELYIDNENDGKIDSGWRAGINMTVYGADGSILDSLYPNQDSAEDTTSSGGHTPIRRQNTVTGTTDTADTDTTTDATTDTIKADSTVTSAKTGDTGVVVYMLSGMLAIGGAALLVKRRGDAA